MRYVSLSRPKHMLSDQGQKLIPLFLAESRLGKHERDRLLDERNRALALDHPRESGPSKNNLTVQFLANRANKAKAKTAETDLCRRI